MKASQPLYQHLAGVGRALASGSRLALLRSRGHRAFALADGVGEWRPRGLPLSTGVAP